MAHIPICRSLPRGTRCHQFVYSAFARHYTTNTVKQQPQHQPIPQQREPHSYRYNRDYHNPNSVQSLCVRGDLDAALKVFLEKPSSGAAIYLLSAINKKEQHRENFKLCFAIYDTLIKSSLIPSQYVYSSLLNICRQYGQYEKVPQLLDDMNKFSVSLEEVSFKLFSTACAKIGDGKTAKKLFSKAKQQALKLNELDCTQLIQAFVTSGNMEEAMKVLQYLDDEKIKPSNILYSTLLKGCIGASTVDYGRTVHNHYIKQGGLNPNLIVENRLISMYGKFGDLESANSIFSSMPERNIISWTTMISAFTKHEQPQRAIDLFNRMKQAGIRPDRVTYIDTLSACTKLGSLQLGKEIHSQIIESGIKRDIGLENSLIHMYCKCGSVVDALRVFSGMPKQRNAVSWAEIIQGLAECGEPKEAVKLFQQMCTTTLQPTDTTFGIVLQACNSVALAKESIECLQLMQTQYGIKPTADQINCVADTLMKVGWTEEAKGLRNKMMLPLA